MLSLVPFMRLTWACWAAAQDAPAVGKRIWCSTMAPGSVLQLSIEQCVLRRVAESMAALLHSPCALVRLAGLCPSVQAVPFGANLLRVLGRSTCGSLLLGLSLCRAVPCPPAYTLSAPSEWHSCRFRAREAPGMPSDNAAATSVAAPPPLSSHLGAFCAMCVGRDCRLFLYRFLSALECCCASGLLGRGSILAAVSVSAAWLLRGSPLALLSLLRSSGVASMSVGSHRWLPSVGP